MSRSIFDGWIAGAGTSSGTRLVLGHWSSSPLGAFSDVMVESPAGHRTLLAPSAAVAAFVSSTYSFDEVLVVPVRVDVTGPRWSVSAGPLRLSFTVDRRTGPGRLLRLVPPALAGRPAWVRLVDLPARLVLPGVRTVGSAGGGRREYYGARDAHRLAAAESAWESADLGPLADVWPPVRFGFGSTPRQPMLVRVTTTVTGSAVRGFGAAGSPPATRSRRRRGWSR